MLYPRFLLTLILAGLLTTIPQRGFAETAQSEHPLATLLADAAKALELIEREIPGYSCTFIKRERVDGKLWPTEQIQLKVRHEEIEEGQTKTPFSVYMRFEKSRQYGRELIYVDGQQDGHMLVRNGGRRFPNLTLSVSPSGALAMTGNRYPVTAVGIDQLLRRMLKIGTAEMQWDECEVEKIPDTIFNGRRCTVIEVTHPTPRPYFQYHLARIFTDDELELPIRFEAYLWPEKEGEPPALLENYTYLNLRLEAPTDQDFDPQNEVYGFHSRQTKQVAASKSIDRSSAVKTAATSQEHTIDVRAEADAPAPPTAPEENGHVATSSKQ